MKEHRTHGTLFGMASASPRADQTVIVKLRNGTVVKCTDVTEAVLWNDWGVIQMENDGQTKRVAFPAEAIVEFETIMPKTVEKE